MARISSSTGAIPAHRRVNLFGMPLDLLPFDTAVACCAERDPAASFVYVVTPNVDHLVRLDLDRAGLLPLYQGAWLSVCDSQLLRMLARLVGMRVPLTTGADLVRHLFQREIRPDDPLTIIGGPAEMCAALINNFGLTRVNHYDPPYGFVGDPAALQACVDFINDHPSRFVLLAIGSPQQEVVAEAVMREGKAKGTGLCIGGSLLFLTGAVPRAPPWFRRAGLEWLYRLHLEPRRLWKRYLVRGPRVFLIALSHALQASRAGQKTSAEADPSSAPPASNSQQTAAANGPPEGAKP